MERLLKFLLVSFEEPDHTIDALDLYFKSDFLRPESLLPSIPPEVITHFFRRSRLHLIHCLEDGDLVLSEDIEDLLDWCEDLCLDPLVIFAKIKYIAVLRIFEGFSEGNAFFGCELSHLIDFFKRILELAGEIVEPLVATCLREERDALFFFCLEADRSTHNIMKKRLYSMLGIVDHEEILVGYPRKYPSHNSYKKYPHEVYESHHGSIQKSRNKYNNNYPSRVFGTSRALKKFATSSEDRLELIGEIFGLHIDIRIEL